MMVNKKSFRQQSLKVLSNEIKHAYIKDKYIVSALYQYIKKENIHSIMLYIPMKSEVNLFPLIKQLRKEKKKVYAPFMEGKSFRLVKYRLPLYKKQFGIQEPNNSKKYKSRTIDLAIVPIVGVDATLRRVGFGKGMYDRFFEKERKNIKKIIFVARKLCYTHKVITDHYDVEADMIVVP